MCDRVMIDTLIQKQTVNGGLVNGYALSVTDIYDRIENEDVEAYLATLEANKEN